MDKFARITIASSRQLLYPLSLGTQCVKLLPLHAPDSQVQVPIPGSWSFRSGFPSRSLGTSIYNVAGRDGSALRNDLE